MAGTVDILMPKLGLTMTEGIVAEWNVEAGSAVRAGATIFSVETEKVVNEIEAEYDGVVEALLVSVGTAVPVGAPVARLRVEAGATAQPALAVFLDTSKPTAPASHAAAVHFDPAKSASPRVPGARIVATPLARRLASERGVDLSVVAGTGPNGRVKAADVENWQPGGEPRLNEPHHLGRFGATASAFSVDIDVTRVLALQAELSAVDIPLCAFVVAALARALSTMPEPSAFRSSGLAIDVARRANGKRVTSRIDNGATLKLSDIARAIVAEQDRSVPADPRDAAIAVFDLDLPALRWWTPRLEAGRSIVVSIGGMRPGARSTVGLSLAFEGAIDPFDAADVIDRVVWALERPMGLLV